MPQRAGGRSQAAPRAHRPRCPRLDQGARAYLAPSCHRLGRHRECPSLRHTALSWHTASDWTAGPAAGSVRRGRLHIEVELAEQPGEADAGVLLDSNRRVRPDVAAIVREDDALGVEDRRAPAAIGPKPRMPTATGDGDAPRGCSRETPTATRLWPRSRMVGWGRPGFLHLGSSLAWETGATFIVSGRGAGLGEASARVFDPPPRCGCHGRSPGHDERQPHKREAKALVLGKPCVLWHAAARSEVHDRPQIGRVRASSAGGNWPDAAMRRLLLCRCPERCSAGNVVI